MLGIYCRTSKESESSIEQQKDLGIRFCIANNFEYEIYEDEGISGFKISDDDLDPFSNRPSFTSLINDIKAKKINRVWVYEHSRLSRNQYASASIFNIFEKHKIELYENDRKLDLNDPQFQMLRGILSVISQYERHLIVSRTTRGIYQTFDKGNRAYPKFFGYRKIGRNENNKMMWKPVQSELDIVKYMYDNVLKGVSVAKIAKELSINKNYNYRRTSITRILKHIEYTSNSFTHEGLILFNKIKNLEIINIHSLFNKKYIIKSTVYTIEIISLEDWFIVLERLLQINCKWKEKRTVTKKRASTGIATGIFKCSICNQYYYVWRRSDYNYIYYKHHADYTGMKSCSQKPKSINFENVTEIFKIFFFINCIVFDNSLKVIEEALFKIKQEITSTNEKLENISELIEQNNRQIVKFNRALEASEEIDTIKILAKRLSECELNNDNLQNEKNLISIKINELSKNYSGTELEKVYYNVKNLINNFFNNYNDEERRNHLIRLIKDCYTYNNYILIDTGYVIFLFDINYIYKFDIDILNILNYKENIFKEQFFIYNEENIINKIKMFDEFYVYGIELNNMNKKINKYIENILNKCFIQYEYYNHNYFIICFDFLN